MFQRLREKFYVLFVQSGSPHKMALSLSIGTFFAFSPFLGIMTWLALATAWIFRVNMPLAALSLNVINNPWSMIPIVIIDYFVGLKVASFFGSDLTRYNPSCMIWLNEKIGPWVSGYIPGTELCFWCYVLGGMIMAVVMTAALYPVYIYCARFFFKRFTAKLP